MLASNVEKMANPDTGPDVLIISVTSLSEESFWKQRLELMRGRVIKKEAQIHTVYEDWPGGAGNALGTFYAFIQADKKSGKALFRQMEEGASVFMYYTAGKGSRLFPLTASEYNNKSRIKLPGSLGKDQEIMTVLEAIIKQTSILAPYRKGRLSVFWGDQIFIPSCELQPTSYEIDLLIKALPSIPDQETWKKNEYHKYGIVIQNEKGELKQLEKLEYSRFQALPLTHSERAALSLGSFSLSPSILKAFLQEFSSELQEKKGSFDTDPHLWMPLSLNPEEYRSLTKNSPLHYERMQKFKQNYASEKLFGGSDMGIDSYWWDYGNCKAYFTNCLQLTEKTAEAKVAKAFFHITEDSTSSDLISENSCLINCRIKKGVIKNSVLVNVEAPDVTIDHSLLVNVTAPSIHSKENLLYNISDEEPISFEPQEIAADHVSPEKGKNRFYNHLENTLSWDIRHEKNPLSFAELYALNKESDCGNRL